ncbi:MAG: pseudouridine synthase [Bacteroidetes bacterium]|nr:MAG: pseudouridine synthase [Bacteroidota bacterium]
MIYRYFLLNKPYGCLSQFTGEKDDLLLGQLFNFPKDVYSIGRLDKDSEGLLLLTNDNRFKTKVLSKESKWEKEYWVQVENDINQEAILLLESGIIEIEHKGSQVRVAKARCKKISPPTINERIPPIRYRKSIPTSWISLTLTEGKNRQVRKMTAKTGFPTLRLIRYRIGPFSLKDLQPGDVIELEEKLIREHFDS